MNRQLKNSIKKPANKGPITGPASNPNVQADIALLLFSFEKISTTNAWLKAIKPEPKYPWKNLQIRSCSMLFDKPHNAEKKKNLKYLVYIFFSFQII